MLRGKVFWQLEAFTWPPMSQKETPPPQTHIPTHTHTGGVKDRQGHRYQIPPQNHSCSLLYTWQRLRLICRLIQSVAAAAASEKSTSKPRSHLISFYFCHYLLLFYYPCFNFCWKIGESPKCNKICLYHAAFPLYPHSVLCFYSYPELFVILESKSKLKST